MVSGLTASLTFAADRPVLLLSSAAAGENERITVNIAIAKIVVIAPLRVLSLLFIWVSLLAEFHQEVGVLIRAIIHRPRSLPIRKSRLSVSLLHRALKLVVPGPARRLSRAAQSG